MTTANTAPADVVDDGLITVDEAMRFLSVSRNTIYRLFRRGDLPCVKLGKACRVPRRAVGELARAHLVAPGTSPAGGRR